MEVSPCPPVDINSKSPDDDVLQILKDLETYAEDMKDDFFGDSVVKVKMSRRKRNRGGKKHHYKKGICPNCNLARHKLCQCPRVSQIPEIPVPPVLTPEVIPVMQPIHHQPPEIVPMVQPIYQPPSEIMPIFLPFLCLFRNMGSMPMVSLGPQEVQILNCKQKKPRMRARGGKRRKRKKGNQMVMVENASAVESAKSEIV